MADYKSPTGSLIVGTLETLRGVALVNSISENGEPDYAGETDIWWDEQKTVHRGNSIVFVDASGDEWTFDQLTKIEDEEG